MVCTIDPQSQERSYSASAYYAPIARRKNLHVLTDATVLNVLIEMIDGIWSATGVRVRHGDNEMDVKAVREVILCAGSIQSPQLLELSGIGQRKILAAAGIEVKIENSNVGENLQDHMSMTFLLIRRYCHAKSRTQSNKFLSDGDYFRSTTNPLVSGRYS
jgi:choline dehydrogenase-like flavoprotein